LTHTVKIVTATTVAHSGNNVSSVDDEMGTTKPRADKLLLTDLFHGPNELDNIVILSFAIALVTLIER